ncbi:MAG: sigma-70 family RNA polymerase sigma factor [Thermoleophilia bacterium]|nr:sigma-70 family RNA polymerase sigma factor [Thermoleophilia bacterium]
MHDARDAEDTRLLEARQHAELLATYYPVILDRCRLRVRRAEADDVAGAVVERLLAELTAGKEYAVPFRVVVHKVIEWKVKEFFGHGRAGELPEEWDAAAPDAFEEWEAQHDFEAWIAPLPERTQQAFRSRYVDGREVAEIGEELGLDANAAHQLLWRGHNRLRNLADG